jgi:(p)ppGpp synthase/HD superfamily hydrolase
VSTLNLAISITAKAFEHKTDRGGMPYMLHCLHVMNAVGPDDHDLMSAAVMHDLIEDTDWTVEDLEERGFSDRVLACLILVTHEEGITYKQYVRRLAISEDARKIKMADLRHNSDIHRMKGLKERDFARLVRYHESYAYLRDYK